MPRTVQISSIRSDGTREDMPATFEDEEVALLKAYLESVDDLLELKIAREGVPTSFEMRIREGKVEYIHSSVPPTEEVDALLHRLRPLILQQEPTSYLKVSSLLGKRFTSARLHQLLDKQRQLFDGRNNQSLVSITSNDTIINCEKTLFDWLNGYEYHRDRDKRERIEALHRFSPNNIARTLYRTLSDVYPVISVGGTNSNDARYQFASDYGQDSGSNSGACVSVYAPAEYIYAARTYTTNPTPPPPTTPQYGYASGTSFASPLVAGIAARYMEKQYNLNGYYPGYVTVYDWIINQASYGTVTNTSTVGYYYCRNVTPPVPPLDQTWLSNPPSTCPSGTHGYDPLTDTWGANRPPYYFPPTTNNSGARLIYFDEGYCP